MSRRTACQAHCQADQGVHTHLKEPGELGRAQAALLGDRELQATRCQARSCSEGERCESWRRRLLGQCAQSPHRRGRKHELVQVALLVQKMPLCESGAHADQVRLLLSVWGVQLPHVLRPVPAEPGAGGAAETTAAGAGQHLQRTLHRDWQPSSGGQLRCTRQQLKRWGLQPTAQRAQTSGLGRGLAGA